MVFLPAIVMLKGPPGLSLPRRTIHLPSEPATADAFVPFIVTDIFSPGSAVPQTGTVMPLCATMWSLKRAAGLTSATAEPTRMPAAAAIAGHEPKHFICIPLGV